jgi:hypothetical protein
VLRRPANLILCWGLAGILGATSLLGGHLHDILGIHHAGYLGREACQSSEIAYHHGPSVAAGHSANCHDEANCPICNYLAQGQVVGERVQAVSVTVSVANISLPAPLCMAGPPLQPFQARAPPAA